MNTRKSISIIFLFVVLLLSVVVCTISHTKSAYASFGDAGGGDQGQEPTGCTNPPCTGGGGGGARGLRWVYFRIKDGADSYNKANDWKIDGVDVSGCKQTEGLYFAFKVYENSSSMKQHQSTMPYNGWHCSSGCNWGCCVSEWMTSTKHEASGLPEQIPVDTSIYNVNVFEPEYILKGPSGATMHTTPALTDLNHNGQIEGRFIWYDKPNDVQLYILNEWERSVRLNYFPGNNYYYDPSKPSTSGLWSSNCKDPNGNYSENTCRILSYDIPNGYTANDGNQYLSNYRAGNHGWRRANSGGEYNKSRLSNVNVTYFCSGAANGKYEGNPVPKSVTNATELTAQYTDDGTTKTKYYDGTSSDGTYTVTFEHTITRNDNDMNNRIRPTQTSWVDKGTSTEYSFTSRLDATTPSKTVTRQVPVTIDTPGGTKRVCQSLTWEKEYQDGNFTGTYGTKYACVEIKQAVILTTASQSWVNNSIETSHADTGETKTLSSWGGSSGGAKTYSYVFTHKLQLKGKSGYSRQLEYYVTQTNNGNNVSVQGGGSSSSPNTANINSVGSNSTSYTPVATYNGSRIQLVLEKAHPQSVRQSISGLKKS